MRANPNELLPQHRDDFVRPGSQLTVTIGRNVATGRPGQTAPMPDWRWDEFTTTVRDAIRDHFRPRAEFGPFDGEGQWDGVREESLVFIAITDYPGSVATFGTLLSQIARSYGQDAIAWSFGPNLLAES